VTLTGVQRYIFILHFIKAKSDFVQKNFLLRI